MADWGFFLIPPLVIAIDRGLKQWVLGLFKTKGQSFPVWGSHSFNPEGNTPQGSPPTKRNRGSFFRLTYVENRGLIFGLFAKADRKIFTLGLGLLLIGALGYLAVFYSQIDQSFLPPARPWARAGLMLILGGGLSNNLIDRPMNGFVLDYLDFGFGERRFYVFNFADICIALGCLLLAGLLFFYEQKIS